MTFSLTAAGGTFAIGGLYTLEVPANAVCVPGSTYGPGEWDSPCGTLAPGESILVMATYGFARGGPVVDFTPDIRFSPATEVRLSTDFYASYLTSHSELLLGNPELLRYFGIYYTADFGQTGKTDAAFDSALITHVDLGTGVVWRRVKHFSGYSATSGLPCTPAPDDPDCIEGTPPPVTHS